MLCEGTCGRSFEDGEKVYATPTRVTIVRQHDSGRPEAFTIVDRLVCERCTNSSNARVTLRAVSSDAVS
jgi:hypothetical protein